MPKVFLGVGHGGKDPGAVANGLSEADLNLAVALACKKELEKNDIQVKLSRYTDEDDDLNEEVKECNAFVPDLAVDIHNNAGGGDGFEALFSISNSKSKHLAECIEAEVVKIGQNTRGLKTRKRADGRDYFGFLRNTKCIAVIVEGAFVDNKKDISIMDELSEQEQFGIAYAKGIMKFLGIEPKEDKKEKMERYMSIDDIPEWGRNTIDKLIKANIIAGTNEGLDLSDDMVRIWVYIDRLGMIDFFLQNK